LHKKQDMTRMLCHIVGGCNQVVSRKWWKKESACPTL
jgi:hypothetical protein